MAAAVRHIEGRPQVIPGGGEHILRRALGEAEGGEGVGRGQAGIAGRLKAPFDVFVSGQPPHAGSAT
jgi:hypothetical protein